jgi:flagellar motor protein MotB
MRRALTAPSRHAIARHTDNAGGDYFASMTDLMLGLVFVFIVVLMVISLDMRETPQPVTPVAEPTPDVAEINAARRDMLHDIAAILAGKLPVTIDEENGTLQLGGDILFPTGSTDPLPDALPKLRLLAEALDKVLPCYAVAVEATSPDACHIRHPGRLDAVYIEGHTDTTPIHTARFQNNWDLSAARASQTFSQFVTAFPALGTLENDKAESLIGVSGYGELRPVDDNSTPAGMQHNRRIELRFIMASPGAKDVTALINHVNAERAQ